MNERQAYEDAMNWVVEAAAIIKNLTQSSIEVKVKLNHSDLVTIVDREVERFLVDQIRTRYPDHSIVGEENINNILSESGYMWIVDPIDGTTNLINRERDYAISIAFCHEDRGIFGIVYNVVDDKLFHSFKNNGAYLNQSKLGMLSDDTRLEDVLLAITLPWNEMNEMDQWVPYLKLAANARGIRVFGSTTIEHCDMAVGMLGAYVQYRVHAWDYAASRVILEELGCRFSDLSGNEIGQTYSGGVIASTPGIHNQIVQLLKEILN